MRLSKNFSLEELILSDYAVRTGLDNTPNKEQVKNLQLLCKNALQPLRDRLDMPIIITSGFRCPALNAAIGGSPSSQHMLGQAADIHIPGFSAESLFQIISGEPIPFDQLIQEFDRWVHISFSSQLRGERLYAKRIDGKTVYTKAEV